VSTDTTVTMWYAKTVNFNVKYVFCNRVRCSVHTVDRVLIRKKNVPMDVELILTLMIV